MKHPTSGARLTLAAMLLSLAVAAAAQTASTPAAAPSPGSQPSAADEAQAREIVERADEIRFPDESFTVEVRVSSTSGGAEQEPRLYRILSRGSEDTIIQTLEPTLERGQNLLMKGRELWVFMPSVSQPVRLSLSQRLTGQVANGDLARLGFARDYLPKIIGSETIDGKEHHVIELVAEERSMTYPRIRYWVRAADSHPHKAEFYSLSGRLLKTCRFEEFRSLGGRIRPTRLVMTDALRAGDESVLRYSALKVQPLPARMFSKEYLKKLE